MMTEPKGPEVIQTSHNKVYGTHLPVHHRERKHKNSSRQRAENIARFMGQGGSFSVNSSQRSSREPNTPGIKQLANEVIKNPINIKPM
mmetsp:Transcript_18366/g.13367  ORF Transcript_18366/g.13367 Transcript_18366/m.13367 type:complete len:88 (-) Transcript_18366:1186-1449(-)